VIIVTGENGFSGSIQTNGGIAGTGASGAAIDGSNGENGFSRIIILYGIF
jgi:hypothetical protein